MKRDLPSREWRTFTERQEEDAKRRPTALIYLIVFLFLATLCTLLALFVAEALGQ